MLDLSQLDVSAASENTTRVELEHPSTDDVMRDDDGNAYFVEVVGDDHPELRKIDRKHADRRSERLRKNRDPGLDQETLEAEAAERLSVATRAWYLPPLEGQVLEFNQKNARMVYSRPGLVWIATQVQKAMKDRKRFFGKPLTT